MTDIRLFRTGEGDHKTIWYYHHNPICIICNKKINDFNAVFVIDWVKKAGRIDNLMHAPCFDNYIKHPLSVIQYRWNVLLTEVIPPKSIPVFIQNPSLAPNRSQLTVFDVDKIHSPKETDNAWRSKTYPSLEGASIGKQLADVDREQEEYFKAIEADPIAYLREQKVLSKKEIDKKERGLIQDETRTT